MKFKYNHILLMMLAMALYFSPAAAQKKKQVKKPAHHAPAKKPAHPAKKPVVTQKVNTRKLGDAVAANNADTTQKNGHGLKNNPNDNVGGTLSEEIVVTTAYKPVLADAVKIRRNPDLEDKSPFKAPLTYTTVDKRLERNTEIKQLDAVKMPAWRDSDVNSGYIKLGVGNLKTTYGEAYIANKRDDALQIGAYLKHFAQAGSTYYKQNQDKGEAGVFGKSIGSANILTGRITYNYASNYFYGFDAANPPARLNVAKQTFNTISAEGELAKNYKDVDRDFTYALKLNGYLFNNAFQAKENNVVVSGFINQTVKQFYAGLSGSIDVSTQKDSLYSLTNSIVRLNPYLKFQGNSYKIDAGINIVNQSGFSTGFYIFPAAKAEFQVIPKYVRLFAEVKGDVNRSSIRDFSLINPFLGQNIAIKNSIDQFDIAAGLKGTLAPGLGFKASIFRNDVKYLPMMINNFNFANGYNRFMVIYDGGKVRISGFNGELDYKTSDDVSLFGRVEIKNYQLATEPQPWNLPKFLLTAGTTIHISNKVNINGTLLFRGSTNDVLNYSPGSTLATANKVVPIASFADLSGGIEYKASRKISIFGQVNNLLNSGYQTWLYYPNYGFNIFGGIGFGF